MSQEPERVYTINLGKVLLSQSQHRAVRAINMIREFARHHMKTENIKIEEDVAHQIWSRGVRSPPRKIRVRMSRTDDGSILVSRYEESTEEIIAEPEKSAETVVEPEQVTDTKSAETVVEPEQVTDTKSAETVVEPEQVTDTKSAETVVEPEQVTDTKSAETVVEKSDDETKKE